MVDLSYLKSVLELVSVHKITQLKMVGLELTLCPIKDEVAHTALTPPLADVPQGTDPIAFTGDDAMNFDKILNWSASPESGPAPDMPLTGEEAL